MASANIFAQFAQPVRSVTDYMDQFDQQDARRAALQGQQQQNALTALALRQRTEADARTVESQNAIRRVAASARTPEDLISGLRATGLPEAFTQADAIEKGLYERKKSDAAAGKDVADTEGKRFQTARDKQAAAVKDIAMFSTPQDAIASMNAAVSRGDIPMQAASLIQRTIPQASGPEFDQWKLRLIVGLNDPAKMAELMKPVLQTRNTGGSTDTLAVDPLTGAVKVTNTVKNTQSPDNAATVGATIRGQDVTAQTTRRGQDMTDSRSRESNQLTREANATVYDPERGVLVNKGTAVARPALTSDGQPLAAKVPESTKKELASIDAQMSVLDGAIRDVKASPGAFTFKRGVATMAGPLTESAVGRLDSSAERDARSYVFNVVSKVINERAGAAQSAQELARLRSFLPAETDNAQQITDKLESFKGYLSDLGNGYQAGKYKPQQPKAEGPARIKSDAEYEALPSGATFVGPDGKTRRKP